MIEPRRSLVSGAMAYHKDCPSYKCAGSIPGEECDDAELDRLHVPDASRSPE
jgi:hypothetical protein